MPEQLELTRSRNLPNAVFLEGSADDLGIFPECRFDAILDFCILHHVEGWRQFEAEANKRGFVTEHKAIDLGLEGYFCFTKI